MDVGEVALAGLPMPPSTNALHRSIGRGKVIKSAKYNEYERQCQVWMLQNNHQLMPARAFVRQCGPRKFIKVDCIFYMHRERILSLANLPQANDTSNRLKAAHDAVAQMLHIDDKFFWCGSFNKASIPNTSEQWMNCKLSLWEV